MRAYNSLWQVRSDSWCRLEEAADRLTRPSTTGELKDKWASTCQELLARLSTRSRTGLIRALPNSRASKGFSRRAHGYLPDFGYRVYTEKAIEMASQAVGLASNDHRLAQPAPAPAKAPKKKSAKRDAPDGGGNLPEAGQDELLRRQAPGDGRTAPVAPGATGVPEVGADELIGG